MGRNLLTGRWCTRMKYSSGSDTVAHSTELSACATLRVAAGWRSQKNGNRMDFALTEEQCMFRDSVAAFARKELSEGALARCA